MDTLRRCNTCDVLRAPSEFAWKNKSKNLLQGKCRHCQKVYAVAHYKANKEVYIDRAKETSKKQRLVKKAFLRDYLRASSCMDCGIGDIVVLDFDHVRGEKIANVTTLVSNNASWQVIKDEIDKCDVVCANCHRRRTSTRAGDWFRAQI